MPHPGTAQTKAPLCPNCGSPRVQRYGTFTLKDGSRRQRFFCQPCARTFQQYTGTILNYLKKRDRWAQFINETVNGSSLRWVAASLRVHVSTAFRWRHLLLTELTHESQPVLTGRVAASNAYVRYSEKGARHTGGPGAYGIRSAPDRAMAGKRPFRRFIAGKPTFVLLANANDHNVVTMVGRGRPTIEQLQASITPFLRDVTELWAYDLAPFAEACALLGIRHRDTLVAWATVDPKHPCRLTDRLRSQLYGWLAKFHGVATRHLRNYLAWYQFAGGPATEGAVKEIRARLHEVSTQRISRQLAPQVAIS